MIAGSERAAHRRAGLILACAVTAGIAPALAAIGTVIVMRTRIHTLWFRVAGAVARAMLLS